MAVIRAILALPRHLAHGNVNRDSIPQLTRPPLLEIPIRSAAKILLTVPSFMGSTVFSCGR